jgi:hypothetical protein
MEEFLCKLDVTLTGEYKNEQSMVKKKKKKHGYKTFLLDEYHTSKCCNGCGEECAKNLRYRTIPWYKSTSNLKLIIENAKKQKQKETNETNSIATPASDPNSPNMFIVLDDCDVEHEPMNTFVDVESAQTTAQEEGLPTDIQYSNQKILRTQGVSIPSLPPEMSIVELMADGACLFNSVSYAISGDQTLAYIYRIKALKYITDNAKEFQEDIQNMTGKAVPEYVKYMTPDHAFGDDIMIIAMCLDFNASISVFIQGRTTIESVTYSPSNPIDGQEPMK